MLGKMDGVTGKANLFEMRRSAALSRENESRRG